MTAYDIIMERGYLGALRYANTIEEKDIVLASEIDDIVTELYKTASGVGMVKTAQRVNEMYQMPTYPTYAPQVPRYSPPGASNPYTSLSPGNQSQRTFKSYPEVEPPNGLGQSALGALSGAVPAAAKTQAVISAGQWAWQKKKLNDFKNVLSKIKLNRGSAIQPQLIDEAAQILSQVPRGYVWRNGAAVELIDDFISVLPKSGNVTTDIVKEAIERGFRPPPKLTNILWNNPLARKMSQFTPFFKEMHPVLESWKPKLFAPAMPDSPAVSPAGSMSADEALRARLKGLEVMDADLPASSIPKAPKATPLKLTTIQKNLMSQLKGKTIQESLDFLATKGDEGILLAEALVEHYNKLSPKQLKTMLQTQIGRVNPVGGGQTGVGALVQEFFITVGKRFPMLKSTMGWLSKAGKYLGPIGVALEGAGLVGYVSQHGWDAKAVCLGLSTLLGVLSLFPALTPITGPIWAAVSIGCMFFPEGQQNKENLYKDENLTNAKINEAKAVVNLNSLSVKDQSVVIRILNQAKGDPQAIKQLVEEAKNNKEFENPLNSLAVITQEWEKNGKLE